MQETAQFLWLDCDSRGFSQSTERKVRIIYEEK
jgi:hypothetical protein